MLKTLFPTLSRVRFAVQLAMLFLTVYGSVVVGTYAADKITGALPALSCAFAESLRRGSRAIASSLASTADASASSA